MSTKPNAVEPVLFKTTSAKTPPINLVDHKNSHWRLLGRYRVGFVKEMRTFANCPVDLFYWSHDPQAYALADDLLGALGEAGWNLTMSTESKKLDGIRIITRSPHLHSEEISHLVAHLRGLGFETKVRVRPELETESVQIVVGSASMKQKNQT